MSRGAISILTVGRSRIRLRWQCKRYLRKDLRAMLEGKRVAGKQVAAVKVPWWSDRFSGSECDRDTCRGSCSRHPQPQKPLVSCTGMLLVMPCRRLLEGGVGAQTWGSRSSAALLASAESPWPLAVENSSLDPLYRNPSSNLEPDLSYSVLL